MPISHVILNKALFQNSIPPVSVLNPAFVVALSIGRERAKAGLSAKPPSGKIAAPVPIKIERLDDDNLRQAMHAARTDGKHVYSYPKQALTGSYVAYESALAETLFEEVQYLAIGITDKDFSELTVLVNVAYSCDELSPYITDAATLGMAMGPVHDDNCFSTDVFTADQVRHSYLTCIGHKFLQKSLIGEKKNERGIFDVIKGAEELPNAVYYYVDSNTNPLSMIAFWTSLEDLKQLGFKNWDLAEMAADLIVSRVATNQKHKPIS